jgi:hypothetical protein
MNSIGSKLPALDRVFVVIYAGYLFGTAGFNRDFARLHVDLFGMPLFIGELAIGLLALILVARGLGNRPLKLRTDSLAKGLLAYLLVGVGFAIFGLIHGYWLAVFRDFALVYYLVFYFFTLAAMRRGLSPATVLHVLALGSVAGCVVQIAVFLIAPRLFAEHGAPGYQALVAWIAVLWLALWDRPAKGRAVLLLRYLGIGIALAVIYLAAYRTMLVIMIGSLAALGTWAILSRPTPMRAHLARVASGLSIVVLALVAIVSMQNRSMESAGTPFPADGPIPLEEVFPALSSRWIRGFGAEGAAEGSLAFRMTTWTLAIRKILASPLVGIGYGPAPGLHPDEHCELASSPTTNCGNAHNTFLTLAMRMGLPVLIYFSALNAIVVSRLLKRGLRAADVSPLAPYLAAVFLSFMLYGFMSLFFESPYLSSLYWTVLALMWAVATGKFEQSGRRSPADGAGAGQAPRRESGQAP